jgi:hypothetical protein
MLIVRVRLTQAHGDRPPGTYVVLEDEARSLALAGVLSPPLELVEPQPDASAADAAALAAELGLTDSPTITEET